MVSFDPIDLQTSLEHFHVNTQDYLANNELLLKYLTKDQIIKSTSSQIVINSGIIIALATMFYFLFGKSNKNVDKKKKKKKALKKETPEEISHKKLIDIKNNVNNEVLPQIENFEEDLKKYFEEHTEKDEESVKSKKKSKKNSKSKSKKKVPAVKESNKELDQLNYTYLYLEETLLKKLMLLDEIEHYGIESLRTLRKENIKYIQNLHKRIDGLKKQYLE